MFKEILNHPNYIITDSGEVYRKGSDKNLLPDCSNGYARVNIDGKKINIGRLVLETFKPVNRNDLNVFYINGDKLDNHLENLVWLDHSDVQVFSKYTVDYRKGLINYLEGEARLF